MKTEEKENALFPFAGRSLPLQRTLSRTYLVFSAGQLIVKPYIYLFTSKTHNDACARPLQGKLLRPGRPGDCLGLLHLRVNLRLSYRTASKYKMVCLGQVMFLLEFGLVMDTKTIDISWHKSILLKATSGNMSKM